MQNENVTRVMLAVALVVAAIVVAVEAEVAVRNFVHGEGRSWRADEEKVVRDQGVDPAVLERIAALVPASATYDVTIDSKLGSTVHGQAFAALLRGRLLPRIEVAKGNARWHILWGRPLPTCCQIKSAGRVRPGEPPVMVVSDG